MIELSKKNRIKLLGYSCVSQYVEGIIDYYYCEFPNEEKVYKVKEDSGDWLEQQIWRPCDDVTAEVEVDYVTVTDPDRIAELDMSLISTVADIRNKIHYELLQILPPDHPNIALFFSKT